MQQGAPVLFLELRVFFCGVLRWEDIFNAQQEQLKNKGLPRAGRSRAISVMIYLLLYNVMEGKHKRRGSKKEQKR